MRSFRAIPTAMLLFLSSFVSAASAQTMQLSCPHLKHPHQALDCAEALFSQNPVHMIVGSVPPGNGFALGLALEQTIHYVSPFAPTVPLDMRDSNRAFLPEFESRKSTNNGDGYKSLVHPELAVAFSTNGSWYATGSVDWLPPLHYIDRSRTVNPFLSGAPPETIQCHWLAGLCTQSVFAVNAYATHRVARTIPFYGLGPRSPNTSYDFRLDETYAGLTTRMPLADAFTVTAQFEMLQANVPPETGSSKVSTNFPAAATPGLTLQPTYVHTAVGFITQASLHSERRTNDDPKNRIGPLLKHRTHTTVKAQASYHWYTDPSTSLDSFQQLTADASLSVELGGVIRRYVVSKEIDGVFNHAFYRTVSHFCGVPPARPRSYRSDEPDRKKAKKEDEEAWKKLGISYEIKVTDLCDFGNLTLRSHLATTNTSGQSIVPFYLQPTVGGQDI